MIFFFKKALIIILVCFTGIIYSQTEVKPSTKSNSFFHLNRGENVITAAIGMAVINGDYPDPLFEFYGQIGYKRFINPFLNINFTYNKFNLAYKDVANNGFMSFDINAEGLLLPDKPFSPFVFAGVGLNASNYFEQSDVKSQIGFGLEYIVAEGIGVKLFTDYNHVFSDLVDGREFGASDDVFWRIGFGINYYFGDSKKRKEPITGPSIINSNPIIHNN
jgi:curli production assembly/transport component CsgG